MSAGNAKTGIYYQQYIRVANENSDMTFMYDGSIKFENSESLKKVPLLKPVDFD